MVRVFLRGLKEEFCPSPPLIKGHKTILGKASMLPPPQYLVPIPILSSQEKETNMLLGEMPMWLASGNTLHFIFYRMHNKMQRDAENNL